MRASATSCSLSYDCSLAFTLLLATFQQAVFLWLSIALILILVLFMLCVLFRLILSDSFELLIAMFIQVLTTKRLRQELAVVVHIPLDIHKLVLQKQLCDVLLGQV